MQEFLFRLMDGGVQFRPVERPQVAEGEASLEGLSFVFTGKLVAMTRDEGKKMVLERGGVVSGSISAKTSYLVAGEKAGSKLAKARAVGTRILTEEQFLAWMNEGIEPVDPG